MKRQTEQDRRLDAAWAEMQARPFDAHPSWLRNVWDTVSTIGSGLLYIALAVLGVLASAAWYYAIGKAIWD